MKLGVYQHYKGKKYRVIAFARHSETLEEMVVYQALYNSKEFGENAVWVRPKKMFFEEVNGKARFEFIGEES